MIFTESSLKVLRHSVDTSRVGINASKGNTMKAITAAITLSITLIAPTSAAADYRDTAKAMRSLTGQHVRRCESTAFDPAKSVAQSEYACNPTGTDRCTVTLDGETVCAQPIVMQAARHVYMHPEDYANMRDGQRKTDLVRVAMWSSYGTDAELPPVGDVPATTAPTSPPVAKPKPVWKCTKKRKGHPRKCRKIKQAKPTKPAAKPAPVVETDPPEPTPAEVAAKRYAYSIASLVSDCSRSTVTYETVKQRFDSRSLWSTKCSPLYYSKLKAARDEFNANFPDHAMQYPSLLIVTQVENVYLKKTGTTSEIANVNCWLAWGSNTTSKPIPTGCTA